MNYDELEKQAKLGAFSVYDMAVMVPEVQKLRSGDIYLEIGVDRGKSLSIARLVADPEVKVYGVDLKEDPKVENTTFIQGDSSEVANSWKDTISLLFIDGDHSYQGCKKDIESWLPFMKKDGVILFHDCDETSPGVVWAVAEFVYTHNVKKFNLMKRSDLNTSIALIYM